MNEKNENSEDNELITFNSPKNFKKGRYVLTKFRWRDLIALIISWIATIISISTYLFVAKKINLLLLLLLFTPGLIVTFLTLPVHHYHCVYEFITLFFENSVKPRKYASSITREENDNVS